MEKRQLLRREFIRHITFSTLGLVGGLSGLTTFAAEPKKTSLTPDQALAKLKQGNAAFLAGKSKRSTDSSQRRLEIARGQTPMAVLVGCSDSRVPPELLLGAGLGEQFIVRNAGNTVDTVALGSIEYRGLVLGVPLIVVLGHERCCAVEAAVEVVEKDQTFPNSIGPMIEPIIPAVLTARRTGDLKGGDLVDAAVRANVHRTVQRLRTSEPALINPLQAGKLRVVGGRYDLDEGKVEFFIE